jgi:uncharacterized protein HemY
VAFNEFRLRIGILLFYVIAIRGFMHKLVSIQRHINEHFVPTKRNRTRAQNSKLRW